MAGNCCHCGEPFKIKDDNKGYHRKSLKTAVPGTNVQVWEALTSLGIQLTDMQMPDPHIKPTNTFLCETCWGKAGMAYRAQKRFWDRRSESSSLVRIKKEPTDETPAVVIQAPPEVSLDTHWVVLGKIGHV